MRAFIRYVIVGIVSIILLTLCGCGSKEKETASDSGPKAASVSVAKIASVSDRLYNFEMVFIIDAAKFLQYKQKLRGLTIMRSGHLERTLVVDMMWSKDGSKGVKPDVVNLVYYDSPEAKTLVENDPEYLALSSLRDSALASVSISGESIGGDIISGKTNRRAYMIEFVQYRDGDSIAYHNDYVKFADTVMGRYGYHLERIIKPTSSDGIAQPDLIRIMYFDSAEKLIGMQNDSDFAEMMKRYKGSVERSLWILGKTPPSLGQIDQLLGKG